MLMRSNSKLEDREFEWEAVGETKEKSHNSQLIS